MADVNQWSWTAVLQTIIGGGIGTAAVQAVLPFIRERWQRKEHAAYMAMRLAVMLEAYAAACASLISDNSELVPSPGEQYIAWNAALPPAPIYPDDSEGWRALDRKLAGQCLNFPNNLRGSQGVIDFYCDKVPDDLDTIIPQHAAERGLEAWRLAKELRHRHDVETNDLVFRYVETLESSLQDAISKDKQRARQSAEFFAEVDARYKPSVPVQAAKIIESKNSGSDNQGG